MNVNNEGASARLWHLAWVGCYISRIDIISLAFWFFFPPLASQNIIAFVWFLSRLALSLFVLSTVLSQHCFGVVVHDCAFYT
jgi:hypothetical protein